jgi:superfamily I DNA/RNA helicase
MSEVEFTDEQKNIIKCIDDNIIVSACAGSGKSSTLVEKALSEITNIQNWKKLSILTYTNKSKQDLEKKIYNEKVVIDTFHGFIYKNIFPFDYEISQNFIENFTFRAKTYEQWRNKLYDENILVSSFGRNDFVMEHTLYLMKRNNLLSYLKSKYYAIYIDEAQDNNYHQYTLLEEFMKLGIKLLMVGDPNQTLYQFRGASPEDFKKYFSDKRFSSFSLTKNFRCHDIIDKIANSYCFPDCNINDASFGYYLISSSNLEEIVSTYSSEKIAYLRKANADLSDYSGRFSIIKDLAFDSNVSEIVKNIVLCLLKFNFQKNYYLYSLFDDLKIDGNLYSSQHQKKLIEFLNLLIEEKCKESLINFLVLLLLDEYIEEVFNIYIQLVDDPITKNFFNNLSLHITMTVHSSKGLEFDNVIINKNDFFYQQELQKNSFYVAFTRAEKRIFVIY